MTARVHVACKSSELSSLIRQSKADENAMTDERKKANKLLIDVWKGRGLPIDPMRIAQSQGIVVEPVCFDFEDNAQGVSGQYIGGVVPTIKYDYSDSSNRQRFTVAHELGHHVMGHGPAFRDTSRSFFSTVHDPKEVSANRFAAELLMPIRVVRRLVLDEGRTDIAELAQRFEVSEAAMRYRLKNIGLL